MSKSHSSSFENNTNQLTNSTIILIFFIIGSIVFINGLFNQFVGDDAAQITDNIAVHSVANIPSFFTGGTFYNGGLQPTGTFYRPVVSTVFSIIHLFFGNHAFGYHMVQIGIHLSNAVILYAVLKKFLKPITAFIVALIFLIHPINSKAVYSIAATQEVLFFFFGIMGLWFVTRPYAHKLFAFAASCFLLSVLSKETGFLFLLIACLYSYLFDKQWLYKLLGLVFSIGMLYFVLRSNAIGLIHNPASAPISQISLAARVLHIPAIILFYLKTFSFPIHLASAYHWVYNQTTLDNFVLPWLLVMIVVSIFIAKGLLLYKKYHKRIVKTYFFFISWFALGVMLHLQIIPLDATVAERWFYFPIVGLLGVTGIVIEQFYSTKQYKLYLIVIPMLLLALSARTFVRSFDWRNAQTLAIHDLKVSKEAYNLENGLSYALLKQGKFEEAKIHAERSISMHPYLTNYTNLGLINVATGNYEAGKRAYLNALQYGDYYLVYDNLAGLAMVYGDTQENIQFIKMQALPKFPRNAKLWFYLAILEYKAKNSDGAKQAIYQAYTYDQNPDISFVYQQIMTDQPLNLNFSVEDKPLHNRQP